MAHKSIMLVCILVSAAIFMAGAPTAKAATFGSIGNSIIEGTVYCTANGSIGVNGTATPPFPNAVVQLRCGGNDQVLATTTTNAQGAFTISIPFNFISQILNLLLTNCRVVVATPLSACNATLPSTGRLVCTPICYITTFIIPTIPKLCNCFQFQAGLNA